MWSDIAESRRAASTWRLPNGKIGPTFGQWVAGSVGLSKGATGYNQFSGALDALTYLAAPDPLGATGRVFAKGREAAATEGNTSYLGRLFGAGTKPMTPSTIDAMETRYRAQCARSVRPPGQGPRHQGPPAGFPQVRGTREPTGTGEHQRRSQERLSGRHPHTDAVQRGGPRVAIADRKGGSGTCGEGVSRSPTTPAPRAYNPELRKMVGKTVDVGSPEGINALGHFLYAAGMDRNVVETAKSMLLGIGDRNIQVNAAKNVIKYFAGEDVLRTLGRFAPDSPMDFKQEVIKAINKNVDNAFGGSGAGHVGQFASDTKGVDLSTIYAKPGDPEDVSMAAAVSFKQAQQFTIPSLRTWRKDIIDLANIERYTRTRGVLSRGIWFENLIDKYVNEKFFQRMALMTGTFAGSRHTLRGHAQPDPPGPASTSPRACWPRRRPSRA